MDPFNFCCSVLVAVGLVALAYCLANDDDYEDDPEENHD